MSLVSLNLSSPACPSTVSMQVTDLGISGKVVMGNGSLSIKIAFGTRTSPRNAVGLRVVARRKGHGGVEECEANRAWRG